MIDIEAVKAQVRKEINDEATAKAKQLLIRQARVVEAAKEVVRAEELKLKDIEAQILDGTLGPTTAG